MSAHATHTRWFFLRRRLTSLLLGGVSVCWLAMLIWSYADTHHEIDELLDAQLIVEARTLLSLAAHEADEMKPFLDDMDQPLELEHPQKLRFQLWTDTGRLVMNSPGTPLISLSETEGFRDATDASGEQPRWRYYMQWNKDRTVRVVVGENDHVREELIRHAVWQLLLPALLGLPILGAWVWLTIRQGFQPLNDVAGLIASRGPEHLDALVPEVAPQEIKPLVESINHLFARVEQTIESEKRFTADAAHELRTPLAALAAQAQVALRARTADERRHAIDQLIASSRRASRLVDQLMTLAKVDPAATVPVGRVDLGRLAEDVCAQHGAMAVEADVTLELDARPVTVAGDADMLGILLRNLVDNAIRYTPAGGSVRVGVEDHTLSVTDTGPGIPAAERERVFDRFHRLAGQDKEGSGLGLSIVARIAERHGATIHLTDGDDGVGLKISVEFPGTPK